MKVSVIIPTYNRPKILQLCLECLLKQDYQDPFEILVVDDGSKNSMEHIVKKFTSENIDISYFRKDNGGPSSARNYGIKNARGGIIALVDDDCMPSIGWIKNIVTNFEKPEVSIVQGGIKYSKTFNPLLYATMTINKIANSVRIKNISTTNKHAMFVGTGNFAIKKSVIDDFNLLLDEKLITREDEDLYRRIQALHLDIYYIDNPVLHICESSLVKDFKRFFSYGRGEYHLQKKWGKYSRLQYNTSLKNIIHHCNVATFLIVKCILLLRGAYFRLGYSYEQYTSNKCRL